MSNPSSAVSNGPANGPLSSTTNDNSFHTRSDSNDVSKQWKFFGMLKLASKSAQVPSQTQPQVQSHSSVASGSSHGADSPSNSRSKKPELTIDNCCCCGTILSYPATAHKFRCSVCETTTILIESPSPQARHHQPLSYVSLKMMIDDFLKEAASFSNQSGEAKTQSIHSIFKPLESYLYESFSSFDVLNKSFKLNAKSKKLHYSNSNVNIKEIRSFFNLLTKIPSKRPLYKALQGANDLLRRPKSIHNPSRLHWLLVLLEIPFLSNCLITHIATRNTHLMINVPEIRFLSYDILKRLIGLFAYTNGENVNYLASWFSKLSKEDFNSKIELINLYITFHLTRCLNSNRKVLRPPSNSLLSRSSSLTAPNHQRTASAFEYIDMIEIKDEPSDILAPPATVFGGSRRSRNKLQDIKIKLNQYTNDWHLRAATITFSIFLRANSIRKFESLPSTNFYNSLVDFVNLKIDFDAWQNKKKKDNNLTSPASSELQSVIDYLHGNQSSNSKVGFFFCQYPFLISLGGKISILEYEARRQMERKAEEAFIMALDKKVAMDVHFKVKVRREYIVQDSLRCIQMNSTNLKKSLRVEFLGEQGIDAGGLKKEWFLLLTKNLFNPQNGMFTFNEESNLLWFNIKPIENLEMYYLFGVILGLAIYNSTILDIKFPRALYKILLDKQILFEDYEQLFPQAAKSLLLLKDMKEDELADLSLNFEATYKDIFGNTFTKELIKDGANICVSNKNRKEYIDKYIHFFMAEGIQNQCESFKRGFNNVVGGNALSLFSPQEIELLICGSEEGKIETSILRSVTKYVGWPNIDEAKNSNIVKWFWEYFDELNYKQQKKVLLFITGSDRVPATGIQTMNFKVSRLGSDSNRFPLAHTCFNEIALYEYNTKEKFYHKIDFAVNESSGFGIK